MEQGKTKLVIKDNEIYEIDLECMQKRRRNESQKNQDTQETEEKEE